MGEMNVDSWVDERFPEGSESVKNWLSRLAPKTARDVGYSFKRWMDWTSLNGGQFSKFSPDDLVDHQAKGDNGSRYEILDLIQKYIRDLNLRAKSKSKYYTTLRSFFLHNRAALPEDPSFKIRSDVAPVKSRLTLDIYKKVVMAANECYAAIYTSMFQGGMGIGEFLYWNETGYESLIEQLKEDPDIIKIEIPGRKQSKNKGAFYTFIGRDAIRSLKVWLGVRPEGAPTIFVNQYKVPISEEALRMYWTRKLKRLGFIKQIGASRGNRYGMNPHEIRDLFRSRWRVTGVDQNVAEFMMGHSEALDKLGYDKSPFLDPAWYEDQYQEAQTWLNVFSEDPQKVPKKEMETLRRKNREYEAELSKRDDRLTRLEEQMAELMRELREIKK